VHADYSQQGAPIRVAIYDDRLEIDNPGVLLSGLTLAKCQPQTTVIDWCQQ